MLPFVLFHFNWFVCLQNIVFFSFFRQFRWSIRYLYITNGSCGEDISIWEISISWPFLKGWCAFIPAFQGVNISEIDRDFHQKLPQGSIAEIDPRWQQGFARRLHLDRRHHYAQSNWYQTPPLTVRLAIIIEKRHRTHQWWRTGAPQRYQTTIIGRSCRIKLRPPW